MRNIVGISQKLKKGWLDELLDSVSQSRDEKSLRAFLDQRLQHELPGVEARAKAAGILVRIWSRVETKRIFMRDRALALLPLISGQERIWLHWGMMALTYPFFRDVAEVIGRMFTLQDYFTTAQIQARITVTWGDRTTSKEATQKLITSMLDWGVLRATGTKGRFLPARKMSSSLPDIELWLLEAMLSASNSDEIEAHQLLKLPEAFPFSFTIGMADLRRHGGFNMYRQGLDTNLVSLRQVTAGPVKPLSNKKARRNERVAQEQPTFFDES